MKIQRNRGIKADLLMEHRVFVAGSPTTSHHPSSFRFCGKNEATTGGARPLTSFSRSIFTFTITVSPLQKFKFFTFPPGSAKSGDIV